MTNFNHTASNGLQIRFDRMPSREGNKFAAYNSGVVVCYITVPDYAGVDNESFTQDMVVDVFENYLAGVN